MSAPNGHHPLEGRGKIHPALHVDELGVVVGRISEMGEYQLVTSDRQLLDPFDDEDGARAYSEPTRKFLKFKPRVFSDFAGRWRDADLMAFLGEDPKAKGYTPPTFADAFDKILDQLDHLIEFGRPEHPTLFASWAMASWFREAFLSLARLSVVGERGCGKSKAQEILALCALNGIMSLDPTAAVLFRVVEGYRPTLCFDEVEAMEDESRVAVMAIVNSGYKRGATVLRTVPPDFHVESFDVYCPLTLSGIKALPKVTEDRCIPVVMRRGKSVNVVNLEVDPADPAWGTIRALCYRLLLTRFADVKAHYKRVALPAWLNARSRELWRPLFTIADLAELDGDMGFRKGLTTLARC